MEHHNILEENDKNHPKRGGAGRKAPARIILASMK
jgi:hypothetical protein